jgi:nucleoside-diphosphate-sugar epimerase
MSKSLTDNTLLVTGATGFLGRAVIDQLTRRGYKRIRCFVRPTSNVERLGTMGCTFHRGDLEDQKSLEHALQDVDGLLNLASLGFGHAPNIVSACENMKVDRCIFVSTTALFTTLIAKTKDIRKEAERLIRDSSIRYTILRPTMIYGTSEDRNIWRLVEFLRRYPAIPVFGNGEYLQQPVYVEDVAGAVVDAWESSNTVYKEYNISGAEPLTYNQLVDISCRAIGRRVLKIHIPVQFGLFLVKLLRFLRLNRTLAPEQILRLNENKAFDYKKAAEDFGYAPISFSEGIRQELHLDLDLK